MKFSCIILLDYMWIGVIESDKGRLRVLLVALFSNILGYVIDTWSCDALKAL